MHHRWQSLAVQKALKASRITLLAGARQCGKTTLAKTFVTSDVDYRTLDDRLLLLAAENNPIDFVQHSKSLLIIDEIQKALELLPAIKKNVDEDTRKGRFFITGSANIQTLPGVQESLAGRVRKVTLRPLSQGEINHHQPMFLKNVFTSSLKNLSSETLSREDILTIAMRGGYPEVLEADAQDRQLWHQNYVEAILERDLQNLIDIRRKDVLYILMQVIAAWSTKMIDISAIGSSLSLQRATLENYFAAIEMFYLMDRIPPFLKTDYARVGKQSKLIMNDSGLMASILRWKIDDIRFDSDRSGKLIETHVANELQKQIDALSPNYVMSHYRDREKREIDFMIENEHGNLAGIEVKAGSSVETSDFKHLKWFKSFIARDKKKFIGIVMYTGQHVVSFGEDFYAVPIACLY